MLRKRKRLLSPLCLGQWVPLLAWRTMLDVSLNVNCGSMILMGSLHMSLSSIPVSVVSCTVQSGSFLGLMDGRHISQPGTR